MPASATLNAQQRAAAEYGGERPQDAGPLLVIAGAGSGKTQTLCHRIAHLVLHGVDPGRLLLLTFTRRAAADMVARAQRIVAAALAGGTGRPPPVSLPWAGTFHSVANRLLRLHASSLGLDPSFTVLDRSDAADLLDVLRTELGFSGQRRRFPKKASCLAIYSSVVNAQGSLAACLERRYPWCAEWEDELRRLFSAYAERKQRANVLDYDDLLVGWHQLMGEEALAAAVRARFDQLLVDEYQDTNALQAQILLRLKPTGQGLTVVGDDAQAIYSFRSADVRNILDFPKAFDPPAAVVTLEQSYRSTQPVLDAANGVIALAAERFTKNLFSSRQGGARPRLVTAADEQAQVDYVVTQILGQREAGLCLKEQAVLFRAAHQSDALELELARRRIPFVKFGGLKFLEAAHVKDLLCVLRWAENPRDFVAGFRVLLLLPGVGPAIAQKALAAFDAAGFALAGLEGFSAPAAAREPWSALCALLRSLRDEQAPWPGQIGLVRRWYFPQLERRHDDAAVRDQDLDQLEIVASGSPSRSRFLAELTLDPPVSTGDLAGAPLLDEDYLILSTIHSAKGMEWSSVFVIDVSDGAIPSDLATGTPAEIEEERRLLYVAMTRAKESLHLVHPLRFQIRHQPKRGDLHVYAPRSRFLPDSLLGSFERLSHGGAQPDDGAPAPAAAAIDLGARLRATWSRT